MKKLVITNEGRGFEYAKVDNKPDELMENVMYICKEGPTLYTSAFSKDESERTEDEKELVAKIEYIIASYGLWGGHSIVPDTLKHYNVKFDGKNEVFEDGLNKLISALSESFNDFCQENFDEVNARYHKFRYIVDTEKGIAFDRGEFTTYFSRGKKLEETASTSISEIESNQHQKIADYEDNHDAFKEDYLKNGFTIYKYNKDTDEIGE